MPSRSKLSRSAARRNCCDDGGGGGVTSIAKAGDTPLTGAVTLSEGTGIALTQVGQDIEIAATGSASDEKVGVSAADTTPDYLNPKIEVVTPLDGANAFALTKAITSPGGNEKLNLTALVPWQMLRAQEALAKLGLGSNEMALWSSEFDDLTEFAYLFGAPVIANARGGWFQWNNCVGSHKFIGSTDGTHKMFAYCRAGFDGLGAVGNAYAGWNGAGSGGGFGPGPSAPVFNMGKFSATDFPLNAGSPADAAAVNANYCAVWQDNSAGGTPYYALSSGVAKDGLVHEFWLWVVGGEIHFQVDGTEVSCPDTTFTFNTATQAAFQGFNGSNSVIDRGFWACQVSS